MSLKTTIMLIIGMSLSFSAILAVFVVSKDRPRHRQESLPVLRAPTAAEIESSRRREAQRLRSRSSQMNDGNHKDDNALELELKVQVGSVDGGSSAWTVDRLQPVKSESAVVDFRVPSQHLDRVQADLRRQVEALKKSRDLMLEELALQLQEMTAAQAVAQIKVLDDEAASIALAKITAKKREAVLRLLDDKRARRLGRLAKNYVTKQSKG